MGTNDTQRILWYLEDDPSTGRKGLYSMMVALQKEQHAIKQQVEDNKDELIERIRKVEEAQRMDKWRFGMLGGAVGAAIAGGLKAGLAFFAKILF
jgi:hypothetical protein